VAEVYPEHIAGTDLAERVGKSWSGGFRNYLSKLRTLELIEGKNASMRLNPDLTG
jgi:predicted transcriptional regulator